MENAQALRDQLEKEIFGGKTDDEIFQFLAPHLGKDRQTDEEVAESLGVLSHPTAAKVLLRMSDLAISKEARKTIRRSLYRLKGRGIAVEEVPAEKEDSIFRPPKAEPSKGFGSGIDAQENGSCCSPFPVRVGD